MVACCILLLAVLAMTVAMVAIMHVAGIVMVAMVHVGWMQVEVDAAGPAIKKLGGRLLALDLVESFSADGQRTAVVVSKVSASLHPFGKLHDLEEWRPVGLGP